MSKNFETPRLIKRYLNRKLYDTSKSQYIPLDELFKLIQSGISVQVLDNKSNLEIKSKKTELESNSEALKNLNEKESKNEKN